MDCFEVFDNDLAVLHLHTWSLVKSIIGLMDGCEPQ